MTQFQVEPEWLGCGEAVSVDIQYAAGDPAPERTIGSPAAVRLHEETCFTETQNSDEG